MKAHNIRAAVIPASENDVWDVYNAEAKKEDIELVKDWRDNLNSLLLFVSLNPRLQC